VLDFGIAKLDSQSEQRHHAGRHGAGHPAVHEPGAGACASSVDHRADLYSLGLCLFNMLTSEFAFYSPNYSEILIGILHAAATAASGNRAMGARVRRAVVPARFAPKNRSSAFKARDEMTEALQAAAGGAGAVEAQVVSGGSHRPRDAGRLRRPRAGHAAARRLSLEPARTQALAQHAGPMMAPGSVVGDSRSPATERLARRAMRAVTDRSYQHEIWPPGTCPFRRKLNPLLLGLGLGLLTVTVVAIALALLGGDSDPKMPGTVAGKRDQPGPQHGQRCPSGPAEQRQPGSGRPNPTSRRLRSFPVSLLKAGPWPVARKPTQGQKGSPIRGCEPASRTARRSSSVAAFGPPISVSNAAAERCGKKEPGAYDYLFIWSRCWRAAAVDRVFAWSRH